MEERPTPTEAEYDEITLADLVRTIYRRKVVLGAVFVAVLLVGVSVTVFATPMYESSATVVPLDHQDIIKNWFHSRQAAEHVVESMGDRLLANLFSARWDDTTGTWPDAPPTVTEGATALQGMVQVSAASEIFDARLERLITIQVSNHDPIIAAEVANAYMDSLDQLRPLFEDITRQALFDRYYDGQNSQEANNRAEVNAKQRDYWLVLDTAVPSGSPSSPNTQLNIALSVVLGLMLGVFAVFLVEWASRFRADAKGVQVPSQKSTATEATSEAVAGTRFRYRGGR